MNISILEKKKSEVLKRIQSLGDMRSGSLSVRFQRCGKSPCLCDDPKHPGHGPIYSLSRIVNGKTKIKNYKMGSELNKLQKEIESYQSFKELSKELLSISNTICELRPVSEIENEDELEELKKKLQNLYKKKSRKRLGA
jgi:hypothetical protein